jgi:hypothetical protein
MNERIDEGRHSEASHMASRRLLWSHGRPTAWLVLLAAACTLVLIKSVEVHQQLPCGDARTARVTAAPATHPDASEDELRQHPGDVPRRSC